MRLLILLLSLFIFQTQAAESKECEALLLDHVNATHTEMASWSKLWNALDHRLAATILIGASDGNLPPIVNREGLQVRFIFAAAQGQARYAVVSGTRKALSELKAESQASSDQLSFQILNSEVMRRQFELHLPTEALEIKKTAEIEAASQKLKEMVGPTILYDGITDQMAFSYPLSNWGIREQTLVKLWIQYKEIPAQTNLIQFLRKEPEALNVPLMLRWGNRLILSQKAFAALKTIEGQDLKLASSSTVKVSKELKTALENCTQTVCSTAPSLEAQAATEDQGYEEDWLRDISNGYFQRMLDLFIEHSSKSLNSAGSFDLTVSSMVNQILDKARADEAMQVYQELGPSQSEGRQLLIFAKSGKANYEVVFRFVQLWKAVSERLMPELQVMTFDANYVDRSLQAWQSRLSSKSKSQAKIQETAQAAAPDTRPPVPRETLPQVASQEIGREPTLELNKVLQFITTQTGYRASQPGQLKLGLAQLISTLSSRRNMEDVSASLDLKDFDMSNARTVGSAAYKRMVAAWSFFVSGIRSGHDTRSALEFPIDEIERLYSKTLAYNLAVAQDRESRSLLPSPTNESAATTPSVEPTLLAQLGATSLELDHEAKLRILDFLKENIALGGISEANGIRRAFWDALAPLYKNDAKKAIYRQTVEDIGFIKTEYNTLNSRKSYASDRRLALGWRLLQKLLGDEPLQLPITPDSVTSTVQLYRQFRGIPQPWQRPVSQAESSQVSSVPELTGYSKGKPSLSLSKEARNSLLRLGLKQEEIEDAVTNWPGISLTQGLPGYGAGTEWTLLFRSAQVLRNFGYGFSRDDAYVAILKNGVVQKIIDDEPSEAKFYRLAAQQVDQKQTDLSLNLTNADGSEHLIGPLHVDRNVAFKEKYKHRLELDQVQSILNDLRIIEFRRNGCLKLVLDTQTTQPPERYMMCVAQEGSTYILKSFYQTDIQ